MAKYTINAGGQLLDLSEPKVMGIINVTPDSFYEGSRRQTDREIAERSNQIVAEGGAIIDIGAFSTRPGAPEVNEEEEMARLRHGLSVVRKEQPQAIVSVDTFRPDVAKMAVEELGADIINDVSEGGITGVANTPLPQEESDYPAIFRMIGRLKVPYILMSVKPNLHAMMIAFAKEVQQLRDLGVKDIILDPGFGFGKTLEENYKLLNQMKLLEELDLPILAGISRKSMIFKIIGGTPADALNGTTAVNMISLMNGASILRVHDVKEAAECVKIYNKLVS